MNAAAALNSSSTKQRPFAMYATCDSWLGSSYVLEMNIEFHCQSSVKWCQIILQGRQPLCLWLANEHFVLRWGSISCMGSEIVHHTCSFQVQLPWRSWLAVGHCPINLSSMDLAKCEKVHHGLPCQTLVGKHHARKLGSMQRQLFLGCSVGVFSSNQSILGLCVCATETLCLIC